MIYAEKDNKVYVINETEKDFYLKRGFNVVDESGETIEYGKGNEQAIAAELKAENEKLKAENEELKKLQSQHMMSQHLQRKRKPQRNKEG